MKVKRLKNLLIKIILTGVLIILHNCNTEEYCYAEKGYKNLDGCYIILAVYNDASDEIKMRTNLAAILATCQYQIDIIKKCKKEPSKWPIPNEIAD